MADWRSAANRHLLAHILKQGGRGTYYAHADDTARPYHVPSHPLTNELTNILLKHAHCWSLDMADWPNGPPTGSEQRASWEHAMEAADRECRQARARSDGAGKTPDNALS